MGTTKNFSTHSGVEMGLTEGSVVLLQFGYAPRPYSSLSREYDPICDPSLSAAYGMDNSR